MSVRQHTIPKPPPITDAMTQFAVGTSGHDLVGQTITAVYQIPDSDQCDMLLRTASGRVLLISADVGYDDEYRRTGDRWEVYIADATETKAGPPMLALEAGQWL